MRNPSFFYQQYQKINWANQEKTKINQGINEFIIKNIILKKKGDSVKVFDVGFGIGFFIKMLYKALRTRYKEIVIEGCEPSKKNYNYFIKKAPKIRKGVKLKTYNSTFLDTQTDEKFDFITVIYVFTHFVDEELKQVVEKIDFMLKEGGKLILIVANEAYLEEKLKVMKDLSIEKNFIYFNGKKYKEFLHYSDIPKIGKIIDINREERFYVDLFKKYGFRVDDKINFNDSGFLATIFVFQKTKNRK
jgi:2-polyprenyl-3-methyl-5-hydroxy-6-metoxy-1,4-benzoquinol methylase